MSKDAKPLNPTLKGRAIVLISGHSNESITTRFAQALGEYLVRINDTQEILMSGRVILAIDFSHDPAHLPAIEADLTALARTAGLDVAVDEI